MVSKQSETDVDLPCRKQGFVLNKQFDDTQTRFPSTFYRSIYQRIAWKSLCILGIQYYRFVHEIEQGHYVTSTDGRNGLQFDFTEIEF